ncbi:pyridoxamine 5'-phosphate oxidase family protein [Anaerovorax odorimutans]|uniref:pyridoxamine 5'-phosphate oxidase family protein n=1 Tax=Anaerovorax odorimutans TaxID=109327 RepID=UPI00040C20E9|nr:pyridoxamine 5'-phosphate oxidase family protein [Anaerovorax odorimutans]
MRRRDREIKDENEIIEILKKSFVCHLAMCSDNKPYVIPMIYVYNDNCLYFHCADVGQKLDILRVNNEVCFEVQNSSSDIIKNAGMPCDWGFQFESVIGFGKAELLENDEDKISVYDLFVGKMAPADYIHKPTVNGDGPYVPKKIKGSYIIKVNIDSMTGKKWNGHK